MMGSVMAMAGLFYALIGAILLVYFALYGIDWGYNKIVALEVCISLLSFLWQKLIKQKPYID